MGGGCASTRQFVERPDLANVGPGTVHIELRRNLGQGGWANAFHVSDSGRHIGNLGPEGVLYWERPAGRMELVAEPMIMSMGKFKPMEMNVEGAQRYSFTVNFPFWYPFSRNAIRQVSKNPLAITRQLRPEPVPVRQKSREAQPASGQFTKHPHRGATAAILTFDARSGLSFEEVALLADRFAVEMARLKVYRLVGRSKMTEILAEQEFSSSCSVLECAVEAGRMLGVQYMIYGSIGKLGSLFTINVYLASVETGGVLASATLDQAGEIEFLLTEGMGSAASKLLYNATE